MPSGTPSGKGLYLTVYPSFCPNTDTECRFKSKSTCKFKHGTESNDEEIHSYNEKERQLIAETKSLHQDIKQLLENAEKQIYILMLLNQNAEKPARSKL